MSKPKIELLIILEENLDILKQILESHHGVADELFNFPFPPPSKPGSVDFEWLFKVQSPFSPKSRGRWGGGNYRE